ncbi:CD1375 family protein [Coprococcus sp. LG100-32]|nr:CD1375 family protein [Coprococcus sp. LG100-32]
MIYIAKVYADLIRKEEKNIEDVPEKIREQVREILEAEQG